MSCRKKELRKGQQRRNYLRHTEHIKSRVKEYSRTHKEQISARLRQKNEHIRLEVLQYYSDGKMECACCGEKIIEFLTIDHVVSIGNKMRKLLGHNGAVLYRWLKKQGYPPGFQVMCFNCNFAKGHGGCPHEKERLQKLGSAE
jgi:5-methylcytosine-specific restriction endonuclease McrA